MPGAVLGKLSCSFKDEKNLGVQAAEIKDLFKGN